jgi:hypothetical protein
MLVSKVIKCLVLVTAVAGYNYCSANIVEKMTALFFLAGIASADHDGCHNKDGSRCMDYATTNSSTTNAGYSMSSNMMVSVGLPAAFVTYHAIKPIVGIVGRGANDLYKVLTGKNE